MQLQRRVCLWGVQVAIAVDLPHMTCFWLREVDLPPMTCFQLRDVDLPHVTSIRLRDANDNTIHHL